MPRFLSPDWVRELDDAVRDRDLGEPGDATGLVGSSGTFTVHQVVTGTPDGDVVLVLQVEDGRMRVALGGPGDVGDADVTVSLGYADAAALSAGDLAIGEALAGGRIRVRGDLSVLVDAQRLLARGRDQVAGLAGRTSY